MPVKVQCPTDLPDGQEYGLFANAFRVTQDINGDFLLDFCAFSVEKMHAKVVARIRVRGNFMANIGQRLLATVKEAIMNARGGSPTPQQEGELYVEDGLLKRTDGKVILLKGGGDKEN